MRRLLSPLRLHPETQVWDRHLAGLNDRLEACPTPTGSPSHTASGCPLRARLDDIGRLALLTGALLACGCGYSNESLHPQTVRTVYVEMFQSREFRRGIEFELTEALRKEINVSTPYTNAPPEKADTILSGEVLEWREASLGWDPIAIRPRETAATLIINYRWKDVRTGRLLRDRPRFVSTVTYVRPAGETVANGRLDAVSNMARNIVGDLENDW